MGIANMNNIKFGKMLHVALLGIGGFLLVVFIKNDVISIQIVLFITLITNLLLIHNKKLVPIKNQIRNMLAVFIFGALLGAILV